MNKIWAIMAVVAAIAVSVALFGFSNNTQSTVSDIETIDIKSQGVTTTLTPEIITIESTSQVISSNDYVGDFETEELRTQSYLPELYFEKAYAVTSSQSSVTVTTWGGVIGQGGFDSSWNYFSQGNSEIIFIDKSDNSKTVWTLPNDDKAITTSVDADSNGDVFFGKSDKFNANKKLTKLTTSTNVFTEYNKNFLGHFRHVKIDSSDNVFFNINDNNFHKLVPSTNLITSWNNAGGNLLYLDGFGKIYSNPGFVNVGILDTNTDTLTKWTIPDVGSILAITADSSGDIFFTFHDNVRPKMARITISDNTLTEWIIPIPIGQIDEEIAVDSQGNVFFGRQLARFVPSTDTFTVFGINCSQVLEIDSSDAIHCASTSFISKIT